MAWMQKQWVLKLRGFDDLNASYAFFRILKAQDLGSNSWDLCKRDVITLLLSLPFARYIYGSQYWQAVQAAEYNLNRETKLLKKQINEEQLRKRIQELERIHELAQLRWGSPERCFLSLERRYFMYLCTPPLRLSSLSFAWFCSGHALTE
eukprot:1158557-Pelagomonas_calceolata.AAC.8